MSFEARCPQCLFLSRQLGRTTPCLLHVSLLNASDPDGIDLVATDAARDPEANGGRQSEYDEPYAFGRLRPTVDRPGPFSLREYVRLQLLRTRLQANPSPLDQPDPSRSLSHR
ncbi:MAG TPA: hypothetical protein VF937_15240 [Chloroflexota bacterium]